MVKENHHLTALEQIASNTANIKVSADSVNLNVNDLETLQTANNNTTSSIDNKVILPSVLDSDRLKVYDSAVIGSLSQINNNVDNVEGKLDTINSTLTAGGVVNISTLSTHALQTTINNTLGDVGNKIDATRGTSDLGVVNTSLGTINTTLGTINNQFRGQSQDGNGGGNKLGVMVDAINTNTITQNGKLDTQISNQTNGTAKTNIYGNTVSDGSGTSYQLHIDSNGVAKTQVVNAPSIIPHSTLNSHTTNAPTNSLACGMKARTTQGTASSEEFLVCLSNGALNVAIRPPFSSVVNFLTSQSVTGTGGTFTSPVITNFPQASYSIEHTFSSHPDTQYEILEGLTALGSFYSSGQILNMSGDPFTAQHGINSFQIRSPFFKIKLTNNGATQDHTINYVVS